MKRIAFPLILAALLLTMVSSLAAKDLRLAYIDSDRILEEFEEFREARQKLIEEEREYISQATALEEIVQTMADELRTQSLMLSDEARAERENRLREKDRELGEFRQDIWGENGRLFTRNLELSRPILEKVNAAIEKVSQEELYDFVFDAASANIVFALPQYDITEQVLNELSKE